ncbi:MAG: HAD hydrolase-like protein [Bdellovibrionales bacterium]|jgi:phosphoglycolate phosphatase
MTTKKDNLIVFDWNGTLLADTTACIHATNTLLKKFDVPPVTRKQYQKHFAMPLDKLYHALGIDPDILTAREHEIHPLWHATYDATPVRLRRGAKTMLQAVQKTSCKSIILSNYVIDSIERQAMRFGIREHFDDIIAFHRNDATFRRRAKGDRLKDYLQASPAQIGIIIGDTEEEIDIGRELGLVTVAITDGTCSTSRLRAMKPDFMVHALSHVPPIAQRVFRGGKRKS